MTNSFPNIGKVTFGKDHNYFKRAVISSGTFGGASVDGYQPDMFITFSTQYVIMVNETAATVEYSFNGTTVHGELTGSVTTGPYQRIDMPYRVVSKIWFRVKSGGNSTVTVQAW